MFPYEGNLPALSQEAKQVRARVQDNDVEREFQIHRSERDYALAEFWKWFLAFLIGVCMGVLGFCVDWGIGRLNDAKFKTVQLEILSSSATPLMLSPCVVIFRLLGARQHSLIVPLIIASYPCCMDSKKSCRHILSCTAVVLLVPAHVSSIASWVWYGLPCESTFFLNMLPLQRQATLVMPCHEMCKGLLSGAMRLFCA